MATKSILKNVSITDKRLAKGLLSALENAEKKQSKTVELKRRLEEVKGVDIKEVLEYAIETGQNSWSGGERITPLTVKEAMDWAKNHFDADEYEEIFGEVGEDGEMPCRVQISFWITVGQKKQAQGLDVTHAEVYAAGLKALGGK